MIAAAPIAVSALSSLLGPSKVPSAAATTLSGNGGSFSDMLASFSNDTVAKLRTSETMSVAGIQGQATTQSVVEAVMSAQEQLQTALAVRDKAVAAFQDISRMPI